MPIVQCQTLSFKAECWEGIHELLTDTLKFALYDANATLNANTTAYSSTNEVVGTGYTAGGVTVTNVSITTDTTYKVVYLSFNSPSWPGAVFTARGGLLYNASKANRSIAIVDFGSDKTANNQTFTATMPATAYNTALIRSEQG